MISIRQIAHACVMSHDLAAAENFYCNGLGLQKTFDFVKPEGRIGFYLAVGGKTFVEVFYNENAPFPPLGAVNHFCFEVASIDEAIAHLRQQGITVTDKKYGVDDTWQAWTNDPSGARIELFEYTEKSAQFVGGDRTPDW